MRRLLKPTAVKHEIEKLLAAAAAELPGLDDYTPRLEVERARDAKHGDYASNLAMQLAKPLRRKPRDIAEEIVSTPAGHGPARRRRHRRPRLH